MDGAKRNTKSKQHTQQSLDGHHKGHHNVESIKAYL